jgi:hypothetical protein
VGFEPTEAFASPVFKTIYERRYDRLSGTSSEIVCRISTESPVFRTFACLWRRRLLVQEYLREGGAEAGVDPGPQDRQHGAVPLGPQELEPGPLVLRR